MEMSISDVHFLESDYRIEVHFLDFDIPEIRHLFGGYVHFLESDYLMEVHFL